MPKFTPKAGSKLYMYDDKIIRQALSRNMNLPSFSSRKLNKPIGKKLNKPTRIDELAILKKYGISDENQFKQMMQRAKQYEVDLNKNKSDAQKSKEKIEYDLNRTKQALDQKNVTLKQREASISNLESKYNNLLLNQTLTASLSKLGAIDINAILRDKDIDKMFRVDIENGSIITLDDNGDDSGLGVDEKLGKYKAANSHCFNDYLDAHIGVVGKMKKGDKSVKDLSSMDKFMFGQDKDIINKK